MERNEAKENIARIFESNKSYGGAVKLIRCETCPPPASGICMVFAFVEATDNHFLSLKRIIDGLSTMSVSGTLNHFEYRGLQGANNQRAPELRFSVTVADCLYEIIFELP